MLSKITTISLCSLFVLFFIQNNLAAKPRTQTNIVIQYNSGGNAFYENCNALDGKVIFTFEQITSPGKYLIQFAGAATFNIDFTLLGFSNDTLI